MRKLSVQEILIPLYVLIIILDFDRKMYDALLQL